MFYAPTSASLPGMAGCCSASDYTSCNWRRTCYASTDLGSTCTAAACLSDAFVLRCTNSTAPVCASWTYPAVGARDFACTQTAGNWTTVLGTAADDFFSVPETYAVDVVWAPETAVVMATSETAASSGATGGAETTAAGAETGGAGGGGTPVGAILGGVVGGVVGLAVVAGAVVVFCCLAKKRRRNGAQQIPDGMVHEADNHASVSNRAAEVHAQSSRHVVELENMGRQRPVEMPGESKTYELE